MLQNNQQFTDQKSASPFEGALSYSAPGKVFLLGEYAVLAGLPALVASVGPRFDQYAFPWAHDVGRTIFWMSAS